MQQDTHTCTLAIVIVHYNLLNYKASTCIQVVCLAYYSYRLEVLVPQATVSDTYADMCNAIAMFREVGWENSDEAPSLSESGHGLWTIR